MHEDAIRAESTHQSASFDRSPAMTSAETLGALVEVGLWDRYRRRRSVNPAHGLAPLFLTSGVTFTLDPAGRVGRGRGRCLMIFALRGACGSPCRCGSG